MSKRDYFAETRLRLQTASRKESGLRLSPAEVRQLLHKLGDEPVRRRTKPSVKAKSALEGVEIRLMIRKDLDDVIEIDRAGRGWSQEEFISHLRQRATIGMVAQSDGRVVAHMVYEVHLHRVQLLNIAVHECYRRLGVGSMLIARLRDRLNGRRNRIVACVLEDDLAMQLFMSACGFKSVDTFEGGYLFVLRRGKAVE